MKTVNIAGMFGNTGLGIQAAAGNQGKNNQVRNGSIFAGNLGNGIQDRIEQKRSQARKQAAQVIKDQFAADNRVSDELDRVREMNRSLQEEMNSLNERKKVFIEARERLKETYGISDESQEQQDLELLQKARRLKEERRLGDLSKEELERIANMGELTEYQERALAYDDIIEGFDKQIKGMQDLIGANGRAVEHIQRESVKNQGMLKADETADQVMAAASDSIQGMLWEDARKHIEEEMEELVEAAKEKAEEKEEQEEKLEAGREEQEQMEEVTELIQEASTELKKLQEEIDRLLKEAGLATEDMKGLMVDGIL